MEMCRQKSGGARLSFFSLMLALAIVLGGSSGLRGTCQESHPLPLSTQNAESTSSSGEALPDAPSTSSEDLTVLGTPKRILLDELHLVQFPRHTRKSDVKWLLPLAGATVASFATDEKTMSEVVSANASFNGTSQYVSDGLRDGFIAAPLLMFAVGQGKKNEHLREAGLLGGEAMADADIIGDLVKLISFRERPFTDRAEGSFYRSSAGLNSSFVSGHSLTAWSSAAVLASEYRNPWLRAGLYTAASGVSLTRVLGQQHFPSDVLLGSAAGWLIGHYVYRRHHQRHSPKWWVSNSSH